MHLDLGEIIRRLNFLAGPLQAQKGLYVWETEWESVCGESRNGASSSLEEGWDINAPAINIQRHVKTSAGTKRKEMKQEDSTVANEIMLYGEKNLMF